MNIINVFSGMSSLYSSVTLSVVRLLITSKNDNSWLEKSTCSIKVVIPLLVVYVLSLLISLPPMVGLGGIGQDMVGVR